MPRTQEIEWNGSSIKVDNSWLDEDLKEFERMRDADPDRAEVLDRISERLQAIEERLQEIEKQNPTATASKGEMKDRLTAILQRREYAKTMNEETALGRLWRRFLRWLDSLFPKSQPVSPGRAWSRPGASR